MTLPVLYHTCNNENHSTAIIFTMLFRDIELADKGNYT